MPARVTHRGVRCAAAAAAQESQAQGAPNREHLNAAHSFTYCYQQPMFITVATPGTAPQRISQQPKRSTQSTAPQTQHNSASEARLHQPHKSESHKGRVQARHSLTAGAIHTRHPPTHTPCDVSCVFTLSVSTHKKVAPDIHKPRTHRSPRTPQVAPQQGQAHFSPLHQHHRRLLAD